MFTLHRDRDLSWNTLFPNQLGESDVIQGPAVLRTVLKEVINGGNNIFCKGKKVTGFSVVVTDSGT